MDSIEQSARVEYRRVTDVLGRTFWDVQVQGGITIEELESLSFKEALGNVALGSGVVAEVSDGTVYVARVVSMELKADGRGFEYASFKVRVQR